MSKISGFLLVLTLTICAIDCSAKQSFGYVYSSDSITPSTQGIQDTKEQPVNDNDLHMLISHNLGVLDATHNFDDSTKSAISKYGTKNIMSQQKFNFLFLIDSQFTDVVKSEKPASAKKVIKHKSTEFSICENDTHSECILDLLFNKNREDALIQKLTKSSSDEQDTEIYLYTSDANTGRHYSESLLSLQQLKDGELAMYDHKFEKSYKIKANLDQCVNNALKNEFEVNVEKRTITSVGKNQNQKIVFSEDQNESLIAFLQDICSVASISKLIRRDTQPSLFTFYLTSLSKLEKSLTSEQILVIQNIFNVVYYQFVSAVKKYYSESEISGQILVLNQEANPSKIYENVPVENKRILQVSSFVQVRNLQSGSSTITDAQTTNTIYYSVLIGFVLLSLWVWTEMFLMTYPRDSIVYAKFSVADYLRK